MGSHSVVMKNCINIFRSRDALRFWVTPLSEDCLFTAWISLKVKPTNQNRLRLKLTNQNRLLAVGSRVVMSVRFGVPSGSVFEISRQCKSAIV